MKVYLDIDPNTGKIIATIYDPETGRTLRGEVKEEDKEEA